MFILEKTPPTLAHFESDYLERTYGAETEFFKITLTVNLFTDYQFGNHLLD